MKTRIAELRKQHKLSQEELANAVGVTRQTITSIEVEKYMASLPLAYKIAHYFGLSIEEVFDFIDDTSISKLDAHELKSRIVDVVQDTRNKAIDEFLHKIFEASYDDYESDTLIVEYADAIEIAEKMKGE